MATDYVVALSTFLYKGHRILPGDILRASQLPNLRAMLEVGQVKGVDDMPDKYDPKELQRLAKDVDANVTEGDVGNPRNKNDFYADAPEGVPNPNHEVLTPETPLAGEAHRDFAGEDMDAVAAETANTTAGADAVAADTVTSREVRDAESDADLDELNVSDLRKRARAEGVENVSTLNRGELLDALRK
jgi:hypothetical protein